MTPRTLLRFVAGGLLAAAASQTLSAQNFAGGSPGMNGAAMTPTGSLTPWHETQPAKHVYMQVRDGSFTVDGLTAKVQLNYDVKDQGFLYFFVPGEGTAVVSLTPMPDSLLVKDALKGARLQFTAGGHDFQLESAGPLVGSILEEKKPGAKKAVVIRGTKDTQLDMYVRFDRAAVALGHTPMFGFGTTTAAPYSWPLSMRPDTKTLAENRAYVAPPLPRSVLPRMMDVSVSNAGTLR